MTAQNTEVSLAVNAKHERSQGSTKDQISDLASSSNQSEALDRAIIKIAHSPDSDDAFMFYGIMQGKAQEITGIHDFEFDFSSGEIEILNQKALEDSDLDICAVSFHAYAHIAERYQILRSGASMGGENYGPRIVANKNSSIFSSLKLGQGMRNEEEGSWVSPNDLRKNEHNEEIGKDKVWKIAIPGKLTSAYLIMQIYCKEKGINFEPEFCKFDEVFDLLAKGKVDASLLIHESQLKFKDAGYDLIADLGAYWFKKYNGLVMPLGCNVIKRSLGEVTINKLSRLLKASIEWGLAEENYSEVLEFARRFAKNELSDEKANEYISMYVNDKTIALNTDDEKSLELMYQEATDLGLLASKPIIDMV